MCPDASPTYSCICCCSSRRSDVSLRARSQNSSLRSVAVNCHLGPSFTMGAGDSSESNWIVF